MVDPRVCPPKADVELADVVRRFGPQYTSQYGHRMMPSQKKALSDIAACCTPELGGRLWAVENQATAGKGLPSDFVSPFDSLASETDAATA
jgi:hypothetical protein